CSPIGDQIGDGYIYFMSNGTDDRDVRGVDSLGDAFLIEGPEVFQAAAASANDHNVHREAAAGVQAVQAVDRPRDLLGGAVALDTHGAQDHLGRGPAAAQNLQHV